MFTIKHITLSDTETLYQAAKPVYEPKESSCGNVGRGQANITFVEGNETVLLTGGTAFVMNEQGKTVARYDLGASNVPLGASGPRGGVSTGAILGTRGA